MPLSENNLMILIAICVLFIYIGITHILDFISDRKYFLIKETKKQIKKDEKKQLRKDKEIQKDKERAIQQQKEIEQKEETNKINPATFVTMDENQVIESLRFRIAMAFGFKEKFEYGFSKTTIISNPDKDAKDLSIKVFNTFTPDFINQYSKYFTDEFIIDYVTFELYTLIINYMQQNPLGIEKK